ncbi:protein Rf1, mitochondrial-like [Panicum miliaceum]|uniref:Protein Rf1, mitochondrial-like n=1 Tax=Panicum miliaceum TaxID=4540 RepID=A0A3L6PWW0_PANMI|nr:protein Rf1, mitochondrial-like [Panicum miliaceum]
MTSRARISSLFTATAASSTASSRPPRSLLDALAAATERARAGTLREADAPPPVRRIAAPARPCPALALFNRVSRDSAAPRVLPPTAHNYGILMDCCLRVRCPDIAFAFFARLLQTGLGVPAITFTSLLKGLCDSKRLDEALDMLLCRMPELGCEPNVISYNVLLKGFCSDKKSQQAVELLQFMAKEGGVCSPDVVSYNTIIDALFKEGELAKACDLLHNMVQQGISPSIVTYNCIIHALYKARAID